MHGERLTRGLTILAAGAAVVLVATACGSSSGKTKDGTDSAGAKTIEVVAGENFWGDIASEIGGSHVHVTSIINKANEDPHDYEATAADAGMVAKADLVIENGYGYDAFLSTMIDSNAEKGRVDLSVQEILGGADDDNPHIWYDTARLPTVANAIAKALGGIDSADADEFRANANKFDAQLAPINQTIAAIKAKYAGSLIAYTERVPEYLTDAAGLKLGMPTGFARAVEQGEDPSPSDTAAFEKSIENHTVKVLLLNTQVVDSETKQLSALANSHGVPVVDVTETVPPGKNFVDWQLAQAKALLVALGG